MKQVIVEVLLTMLTSIGRQMPAGKLPL